MHLRYSSPKWRPRTLTPTQPQAKKMGRHRMDGGPSLQAICAKLGENYSSSSRAAAISSVMFMV